MCTRCIHTHTHTPDTFCFWPLFEAWPFPQARLIGHTKYCYVVPSRCLLLQCCERRMSESTFVHPNIGFQLFLWRCSCSGSMTQEIQLDPLKLDANAATTTTTTTTTTTAVKYSFDSVLLKVASTWCVSAVLKRCHYIAMLNVLFFHFRLEHLN